MKSVGAKLKALINCDLGRVTEFIALDRTEVLNLEVFAIMMGTDNY